VSYRVRLLECGSNCDDSPHRLREQSDRTGDVTNDTRDQVGDAAHAGVRRHSVLFATSRFSTDEILGVGNQLKRSVGQAQLRDEMRKRLEGVRTSLSRAPTPPPQMP
jgi:hypothetical protein